MSIAEKLAALAAQKNALADNLNTMGVTAARSERLNTLVPKVLDIHAAPRLRPLSAGANGLYLPEEGCDGFSEVSVSVPGGGSGRLYLIDPAALDAIRDFNGQSGSGQKGSSVFPPFIQRYERLSNPALTTYTVDGVKKPVVYWGNGNSRSFQLASKIPADTWSRLVITCAVTCTSTISYMGLRFLKNAGLKTVFADAEEYADGSPDTVWLTDYSRTAAAICAQEHVTISSTDNLRLAMQTVTVDLRHITSDCYLTLSQVNTTIYLRELYLE